MQVGKETETMNCGVGQARFPPAELHRASPNNPRGSKYQISKVSGPKNHSGYGFLELEALNTGYLGTKKMLTHLLNQRLFTLRRK